ncbi:MAG TPA: DUF1269 domain-containing protein [Candidatus Limnocylindrales bacterium]|nr:DUF1269 domain-containing protein [Candidatus Limnocylindrales bacterium]
MNQLIVIAFDHFADARNALKSLRELEHQRRIRFEDTALVERDPDGTAHVTNEVSGTTETAVVAGAIIGGLLSFVFPPAGIAIGAALGAVVGSSLDTGVSGDFVNEVKTTLRPGRSALFLVVKRSDADALMAVLRSYSGDLIQTTLDSEGEDALREALE